MSATALVALSGTTIGIAFAGSVWAARARYMESARPYLIAIFMLFALLAGLPFVAASSDPAYLLFVPVLLPALLAIPVAIYRFVVTYSKLDETSGLELRDVALPVLGAIVMLGYWVLPSEMRRVMLEEGNLPPGPLPGALALMTIVLLFCWIIASFVYLAGTVRHLRRHRRRLKDLYSDTGFRELRWIDWFMVLLALVWCAAALALIGENSPIGVTVNAEAVLSLQALLLLFLIAFAPLSRNLEQELAERDALGQVAMEEPKYARSALSEERVERLCEKIEGAMADDSLFLDPNLSLQKLSSHVGALPNHVSQVLNDKIGATFFDYVARWRVGAAEPLIRDGKASVLAIALDVGFNSRSTFYKAFKRETGMTPKEFRDRSQAG